MMRIQWIVSLALCAITVSSQAQTPGDAAMRAALAPTGTLRAAFLATNPVQAHVDPQTGEVTGIAADIAHELGRRMGVDVAMNPGRGVPAVIEAVQSGAADIGFLAYAASRAEQVDYAQVYVLGHNSYLVLTDSPIHTLEDADRAGVRIGAREGVAVDLFLTRSLERAELVHLPRTTSDIDAARLLLAGEIDAYATNVQRLSAVTATEPRVRIVDGSLMSADQAIVVAQGNDAGVAYLNRFLDEARSTGLLQRIVSRYELAGVEVAPPNRN
jgi:polar amino acid transport system substrate-binding protein